PGGRVYFTIEALPDGGHTIWGEGKGTYWLSPRGDRVMCAPESSAHAFQRFLIAQVLPFAALLAGVEIFHASAVMMRDGSVVGFAGPSGAGKTSLALAVCRHSASFFADDVLALEPNGAALLAHPGAPIAGVDLQETGRLKP